MERLPSWLLTQTAAHAGRLVSEGFATSGGRGYHYRILNSLHQDGPTSQASLGRRTGIYQSDIVAALNELQAGEYVMRILDRTDKRRNVITITPKGRERMQELAATAAGIQDALLEPLDETERQELTRLLTKLYEHHRQGFPPLPMK
ncbi:MarR family transcriptional regulator [Actinoplanes sp. NPDC026619]|uniref:MarR family winged helix-turn-helix transcriptional regulator n=1 Tax=Actinoplanes sp. NPDC026619 TaxID=3155798 RepID=UPI0033C804F0